MKVRLFASLRELAGSPWVEAPEVATVGSLLDALSARYGPGFDRVMAAGTVVVNGRTVGREAGLDPTDEVALLPPVSGGAVQGADPTIARTAAGGASTPQPG